LSPDGKRLALLSGAETGRGTYIYEIDRGVLSRVAMPLTDPAAPIWTPDGKHLVVRGVSEGSYGLWWINPVSASAPVLLLRSKSNIIPTSISPDGRFLGYHEFGNETNFDISILPVDVSDAEHPKPGTPQPVLHTEANERDLNFSPDGHWVAYTSTESGGSEVYVRSFPEPAGGGAKVQVSAGGGQFPRWSPTAKEIFYVNPDSRVMVSPYSLDHNSFQPGKQRVWSNTRLLSAAPAPNMDVTPDGQHIVFFPEPRDERGSVHATFLFNFFDELRRRLPSGK
jgi:Tol biopolymer transport system component